MLPPPASPSPPRRWVSLSQVAPWGQVRRARGAGEGTAVEGFPAPLRGGGGTGGCCWGGGGSGWAPWGAGRRRGHRRVPLAGAITYLLRSGWGERGTKRGGGDPWWRLTHAWKIPAGSAAGGSGPVPCPTAAPSGVNPEGLPGGMRRGSPPLLLQSLPREGAGGGSGPALRRKAEVPTSPLQGRSGFTPPGKAPLHSLFRIYTVRQSPFSARYLAPGQGRLCPPPPRWYPGALQQFVPQGPVGQGGDRAGEGGSQSSLSPQAVTLRPGPILPAPSTHASRPQHRPAKRERCPSPGMCCWTMPCPSPAGGQPQPREDTANPEPDAGTPGCPAPPWPRAGTRRCRG